MTKYELTIVLAEKASAAKKKKVQEVVTKAASLIKSKVGKVEDWGVVGTGNFLHFPLELEEESVKGLKIKLSQEGEIKKFLIVKANGKKSK